MCQRIVCSAVPLSLGCEDFSELVASLSGGRKQIAYCHRCPWANMFHMGQSSGGSTSWQHGEAGSHILRSVCPKVAVRETEALRRQQHAGVMLSEDRELHVGRRTCDVCCVMHDVRCVMCDVRYDCPRPIETHHKTSPRGWARGCSLRGPAQPQKRVLEVTQERQPVVGGPPPTPPTS